MHNPHKDSRSRRTFVRVFLFACLLFIVSAWYAVAYSTRARRAVFRGFVAGLEDHGARLSGINSSGRTIAVVDLTASQFSELTLEAYLKKCDVWRIDRLIVGTSYSKSMVVRLRRNFNIGIVEECTSVIQSNTEKETAPEEPPSLSVPWEAGTIPAETKSP